MSCNPTYSGSHEVLVKYLRDRYNVEVTLVGRLVDEYRKAVKSNTKVRMGYRQDIEMDSLTEFELKCRLFYDRLLFLSVYDNIIASWLSAQFKSVFYGDFTRNISNFKTYLLAIFVMQLLFGQRIA